MTAENLTNTNPLDTGRDLIENLPVGIIIFTPDGIVSMCNEMAMVVGGKNRDGITGQKAGKIPFRFFREDGTRMPVGEYPFMKVLSSGLREENTVLGVDLDDENRKRWILAHAYPEYDRQNRLERVVMVLIDISKRKDFENQLREEQNLARSLMEYLPDAIYFKDKESRFIRINNAEARLLGLDDPAAALGKTDFDFFAEEHACKAFHDEQEILRTGKPMVAKEEKLILPDGRTGWALSSKMPLLGQDGETIGTFGISYDISRRKAMEEYLAESESRFRTLFEGAAVGVAMMETRTGKFLRVNKRYCEMLGYSENELRKIPFIELTHKDDIEDSNTHMQLLKTRQIREFTIEKRYIRKDGSILFAEVSVAPMWAPGEEPTTHITVAQDISERKRAELAERAAKDFLEKLVDNANAPIVTWDSNLHITLFNHAFEELTGIQSSEILGKPFDVLFPEESREKSLARVVRTLKDEQLQSIEIPIQNQNGSIRLVVWNSSSIYIGAEQSEQAVIAIGQDITERYQVEQSLLRHAFELELGQRFSRILRHAQTVDELADVFIKNTITNLSLSSGALYLEDPATGTMNLQTGEGWLHSQAPRLIHKDVDVASRVRKTQKPILMDGFYPDLLSEIPDSSIAIDPGGICIPLATEGELIGMAFFAAPSPEEFHEQEIRLIMILAEIATGAIKRTRLRQALEHSYEELKLIDARRQKIQDLLAREKNFLNVTLMSIGDALIRVNKDGIISLFNMSAEEITEYPANEALGRPLEEVFKMLDYDTNEAMKDTIQRLIILDKIEKTSPDYRVQTLITRTGKRIWRGDL
jgi:PAS domain S-box-containing protein